jgi:Mg-chelatase subunit ChlD/uncharacterized membrane protein
MSGVFFEAPIVLLCLPALAFYLYWAWQQTYVNFHPLQVRAQLLIRGAVMLLLVLAAARMGVVRTQDQDGLIFLVDVSSSMSDKRLANAQELVQDALLRKRSETQIAAVTFAAEPRRVPLGAGGPPRFERHADGQTTDLARAIRYAEGLFPEGTRPRVAVISDGRFTRGDTLAAAREAQSNGLKLNTIVLAGSTPEEVWIKELILPETLRQREAAQAVAVISSTTSTRATVTFSEGDTLLGTQSLELKPGDVSVPFEIRPRAANLVYFTARITAERDTFKENNVYSRVVRVVGDPQVLVLYGGEQQAASYLVDAWRAQGIDVESKPAAGQRLTAEVLARFDLVVLCEVDSSKLDRLQQATLEAYVRNLGGGLIVIAGEDGLRGTGEATTPIGRMVPLGADPRGEKSIPPVAMVLVIDRSGSMTGLKLEMAKRAALAAVDEVGQEGQIGVLGFSTKPQWIVEPTPAANKDALKKAISEIATSGGTRIYPALEEAYYKLGAMDAGVKHMLLMTDGLATDGQDYAALARKALADKVTISTVALTSEADRATLKQIADAGGGRAYYAATAEEVPRIFVQEARTSLDQSKKDRPVPIKLVRASAVADSRLLNQSPPPPLYGVARTTAKGSAEVIMQSDKGEPVLGWWRYGLGQVTVWASDATGRWAREWVTWQGFAPFFTTMARATMRSSQRRELTLELRRTGQNVRFEVFGEGPNGRSLNELDARVVLQGPGNTSHNVQLSQQGPGIYRGEFDLPVAGPHLATPVANSADARYHGPWETIDYPYSPEFASVTDDLEGLRAVADAGGGKHDARLPDLLTAANQSREPRPLDQTFLLLAVLLFVVDVLLKRVRLLERAA